MRSQNPKDSVAAVLPVLPDLRAPTLEAVLAHSTPQPGQIVLGELLSLPQAGQSGIAAVPGLGCLELQASLVALGATDLHQRVALSLLANGQALLLGRVWDGATAPATELRVDGETQDHRLIEAEHSIELRCGESAIVLLADGRIQLRGNYITSYATATQRIVGGAVHVN